MSPKFLGWTDDTSGLDRFEVEVYRLSVGASGTLEQLGDPEVTATVTPEENNFQYTAPRPGVYAIVVTVYDAANNSARARKIFNYDNQPAFTMTHSPAYFREAGGTNKSFITTLETRDKLTVTWAGRFVAQPVQQELRGRVQPWPIQPHSIDDIYGTAFGLRSVSALIDGFSYGVTCVYIIDPHTGGRGFAEPQFGSQSPDGVVVGDCSADVNLETETATLNLTSSPLNDGDTVVVWLRAFDHRGESGSSVVKIKSTFDTTGPSVSTQQFFKNRYDESES